MKDIRDYSLLAHNTFGIDAKCKRFLEYSSVEEAQQIVAGLTAADQPLLILGGRGGARGRSGRGRRGLSYGGTRYKGLR